MLDPPIGPLLKRLHGFLHADASRLFNDTDLTPMQARVLISLHMTPGETARMKEMEARFHVTQPTVSGLVTRLEKKKLVETFTDPADARVKCVRLTDTGRDLCDASRQSLRAAEERMVACLSPSETATLTELLERMCHSLDSQPPSGTNASAKSI